MKIFITGCTGIIGKTLTSRLLSEGHFIGGIRGLQACEIESPNHTCQKLMLSDWESSNLAFVSDYDVLIHLAWITTPNKYADSSENYIWLNKSKMLFTEFKKSKSPLIISSGTCLEYGEARKDFLSETENVNPSTIYAKCKLELLNFLSAMNVKYIWPRTFFQYGELEPNQKIISTLISSSKSGLQMNIRNPLRKIDYIYYKDVAEIYSKLLNSDFSGVINAGTGTGYSIEDLANYIYTVSKNRINLISVMNNKIETDIISNNDLLFRTIGEHKFTSIEEGIHKMLK